MTLVGTVQPVWDSETDSWMFSHPAFSDAYYGETPDEVIQGYPLYLGNLFEAYLSHQTGPEDTRDIETLLSVTRSLAPPSTQVERRQLPTRQIRVPSDIADWLQGQPSHWDKLRQMMG